MIRDYSRFIEKPWESMCANYFSGEKRPLHATDIKPSDAQIASLNSFFTKFEFFRVAALASKNTLNISDYETIDVMANVLLKRICDVAKWADFDRLVVIFEESQRIEMKIMNSLSNKKAIRNNVEIPVELGLMPKSSCNAALEVADFIIHAVGRQVRHRNMKDSQFLPDFTAVFKTVDIRLQSFMEVTSATEN